MNKNHGTPLTSGQRARFLGEGTKALALVADRLGSEIISNWARNSEAMQRVFFTALLPPIKFEVWKTIKLGTGLKTINDFRHALKNASCKVGTQCNKIFDKCTLAVEWEETDIDLVVVRVDELGFEHGATCSEIYKRAQEFGLLLCPVEVALQLRLQYLDQPKGQRLQIAMEPIAVSDDEYLTIFSVEEENDGPWLYVRDGHPNYRWLDIYSFVFVRRK